MKTVPYTTSTGIQIGCRYNESPKPMPIEDDDMVYIQSVLICPPSWHRQKKIERRVLFFSAVLAVIICIASVVPK